MDALYHYTTIDALQKILEGKDGQICFRASSAESLNDPNEYKYAMSFLISSLKRYEKHRGIAPQDSKVSFVENKKTIFQNLLPSSNGTPTILSFAKDPDNLTMWRFYGIDGKGVSIGINHNKLREYASNDKRTYLLKCLYGSDNTAKADAFWENYYENILFSNGVIKVNNDSAYEDFFELLFTAKSQHFKPEEEWRLAHLVDNFNTTPNNSSNRDYINRHGSLVPFYSHLFNKEFITSITVGPNANAKKIRHSIICYLWNNYYPIPEEAVKLSKIKYRSI